jgi:hypothetical protein
MTFMNHLIAVSFASGYGSHRQVDVYHRMAEALTTFSGESVELVEQTAGLLVLSTDSVDRTMVRRSNGRFMMNVCAAVTNLRSRRRLSQSELADAWFNAHNFAFDGLGAPFVLCGKQHPDGAFAP